MIAPVVPDCTEKTGKREAAWRMVAITLMLTVATFSAETWMGTAQPFLQTMVQAFFGLASLMMLGAYGIAAAKQAGVIGGKE